MSSQGVSLGEICSICASLERLVQALMDQNAVALIVGSTGEATFTKQGTKVLSEASLRHPIEKLIVNACNKYHTRTGEDIKIFLLLLTEMMRGVKKMLDKSDDMSVRRTLTLEIVSLVSFTPRLFESIRDVSAIVSDPSGGLELFREDLYGIVRTFIGSKFPRLVSDELSGLICRFLVDSINDWSNVSDALRYLISHFDLFCSKALLPLHKSSIHKGFLLHQRFISSMEETSRFIVVSDVSQKSDEVCWSVDSLLQLRDTLWKNVAERLTTLRGEGVSVILTHSVACDNFKSMCSQCNVTLIDNIPSEDIANIVFFTAISPLNSINETLVPKNVACIQSIKPVSFDSFHYTHLDVVTVRDCIVPNHVVLCALTDAVWKEYYGEFYNCLKVVQQWLEPSINVQHKNRTKDANTESEYRTEPLSIEYLKAECDIFQGLRLYSKSFNKSFVDSCSVSEQCNLGFSFPTGLWEFVLQNALTSASFPKHLFPNLCNIFESALLQTVCQIWNVPLRNYDGQKSYYHFYRKMKGKEANAIVPLVSRESQLLEVLQLLQQLLKIDAIVGSK